MDVGGVVPDYKYGRNKPESEFLRPSLFSGLDYWTGLLDWTTGLDYWTGLLDWTTGLDCWTHGNCLWGEKETPMRRAKTPGLGSRLYLASFPGLWLQFLIPHLHQDQTELSITCWERWIITLLSSMVV